MWGENGLARENDFYIRKLADLKVDIEGFIGFGQIAHLLVLSFVDKALTNPNLAETEKEELKDLKTTYHFFYELAKVEYEAVWEKSLTESGKNLRLERELEALQNTSQCTNELRNE